VRWTLRVVAALVVLVLLWLGWIAAHIAWYRYNPPRETAFMAQRMAEARARAGHAVALHMGSPTRRSRRI
jgi:hypothetical protein